ncbi:MAG: NADH-quinone oxidoreductase subunit J [Nitriliruptorales bacterium]|nr:NADH-quinone oxidoreductase subunit J [Nitriliruptorales bacterium]
MTRMDLLMLGVAVIGGASAILVVTARNVVHSALYLVVALLTVAATFLLVGAEFLAWAQVLVYVGAVVVLILFGLMLTRAPIGPMAQGNELGRILPIGVSGALFAFLATVTMLSFGDATITLAPTPVAALGEVLYVYWAFPFMAIGFFLTVALIGAIVIARREEGEGPLPPQAEVALPEATEPAPIAGDTEPGRTPVGS